MLVKLFERFTSPEAWAFWTEVLRQFGPIILAWILPSPVGYLARRRRDARAKRDQELASRFEKNGERT